jgi:hypothetical protein
MDLPQAQETLMVAPATRPWRARALAVIAAVLAALAVWLVTDPLLGVDLAAPTRPGSEELQSITPALVAGTSLVTALAGWGLLALLERFTARPRTIWTAIAVLVGLLSLAGPLSTIASTTVANGLSLALMHLAVAAVLIPGLAATAPSLARPAPAGGTRRPAGAAGHGHAGDLGPRHAAGPHLGLGAPDGRPGRAGPGS